MFDMYLTNEMKSAEDRGFADVARLVQRYEKDMKGVRYRESSRKEVCPTDEELEELEKDVKW